MARGQKKCYTNRGCDGEELIYQQPKDLLSQAYKYFDWCNDNPWHKQELIKSGARAGELIGIPIVRPYTLEGLCVFCGISISTFRDYEERADFEAVTTHLREIIRQNQIEGECIGAYNAAVMSKIQGLTEKQEVNQPMGLTIHVISPEAKDNLAALKELLSK